MTRYYTDLQPLFADPADWTLPRVLRARASEQPDACYLVAPLEGASWTYAEILAQAERVGGALHAAGARFGDRVLILAANSSQFVRSWLGSVLGGLVEVPVNTAYEGEFLRHQLVTAAPRWAVVDDGLASRVLAVTDHAIECLWVIDNGSQAEAIELLQAGGLDARPWEELCEGPLFELADPSPQDLASIFFTSGTTGPSKGVAMPHAQMHFFAEEVVALTRLTAADTYLAVTPLFHGNAQFMAAYPALVAGARLVLRPKFSASQWIDHVRADDVTVTNLLGVMMDFAWKQPPRADDRDNKLRAIFAAPTASSIVDAFAERYGIEAFVEVFGLTETSAPILSPYGEPRPPGAAGLAVADWFDIRLVDPQTDIEVETGRDRGARGTTEVALDRQPRLLRHGGAHRGGLAKPLVSHRRCAAARRGGLVLLRRPLQGRAAPPRREHQLLRGRAGDPRPRGGARVRGDRCRSRHRGGRG